MQTKSRPRRACKSPQRSCTEDAHRPGRTECRQLTRQKELADCNQTIWPYGTGRGGGAGGSIPSGLLSCKYAGIVWKQIPLPRCLAVWLFGCCPWTFCCPVTVISLCCTPTISRSGATRVRFWGNWGQILRRSAEQTVMNPPSAPSPPKAHKNFPISRAKKCPRWERCEMEEG